jgi:hypothetical protein
MWLSRSPLSIATAFAISKAGGESLAGIIMSLEEPFKPVIRGGVGELCVGVL